MDHAKDHELGEAYAAETGFVLGRDPDTVLALDVAFVRAERIPSGGFPEEGFGPIAPDLAVEIVSPGDRAAQVAKKVRLPATLGRAARQPRFRRGSRYPYELVLSAARTWASSACAEMARSVSKRTMPFASIT